MNGVSQMAMLVALGGSLLSANSQNNKPAPTNAPPPAPAPGAINAYRVHMAERAFKRPIEYDGAVVRSSKSPASQREKLSAADKYRKSLENVSRDPVTGQGMGVYLFVIKF